MKIAVMMLLLAGTVYGQTSNPGGGVGPAGPAGATGATGTQGVIGATGSTGTAGTAGATGTNGVVNMRGAYAPGTAYALGDGVSYVSTGTTYVNILASTGVLPTVTTNWTPLADAPSAAANAIAVQTTHGLSVPGNCVASGGTATAYTCATSPTFSPATGDHIQFSANVANTGSATLSVNGATAAIMHKVGGSSNLVANDLLSGHWVSMTYDGVYWQLEGQLGNAYATSVALTAETTRATNAEGLLAPLASPALSGTPTAPTPTVGDSSLRIPTTAFSSNATNLTAGVIPVARLPIMVGSGASHAPGATPDPGVTAGTARYLREDASWVTPPAGASLPATGDLLVTNPAAQAISLRRIAHFWCGGTSFHSGYGNRYPAIDSPCALTARDTEAGYDMIAAPGTTSPQIAIAAFANVYHDATYPDAFYYDSGLNDGQLDACGATAGTFCTKSFRLSADAWMAYNSIPDSMRIRGSNAGTSGSVAANTTAVPFYTDSALAALGTATSLNSNGTTATFAIPNSATSVGVYYAVSNTGTGTATVGINQNAAGYVLQNSYCTATTAFTNTGCGGQALPNTTTGVFRQQYPLTAGVSHFVQVISTSANPFVVVAADYTTATMPFNTNPVFVDEVPNITGFANTALYNSELMAVVAQESALGLPIYTVLLRTGTPGLNTTTDISTTPTTTCYGAVNTLHPNDGPNGGSGCGSDHMAQTLFNAELANGWQFSTYNGGAGAATRGFGKLSTTVQTPIQNGSHFQVFNNANAVIPGTNPPAVYGTDYLSAPNSFVTGFGEFLADGSTGAPWSGKVNGSMSYAPFVWCARQSQIGMSSTAASSESQFTTRACFDLTNGNLWMQGVTESLLGTIASAATIAPVTYITHVTGTSAITTITLPSGMSATYVGCLKLWPDAAFTWATGGNILTSGTAVVNVPLDACYGGSVGWSIK